MSDDDSKNLPPIYENLPCVSGNLATNQAKGTDTSSSDLSTGSIGKEDLSESKVPLISPANKRKSDDASNSDCPITTEQETSNESDLPLESPTNERRCPDTSCSYITDSIEKEDSNIKLPANKRTRQDTPTSDISTVDSSDSRNPTYANVPRGISDASLSNYVTMDAVDNELATTSRAANLTPISTTDQILLILKDILECQKNFENRLNRIDTSIAINRDILSERFRISETEHATIRQNQGSLAATLENLGNNLTVYGERVGVPPPPQ